MGRRRRLREGIAVLVLCLVSTLVVSFLVALPSVSRAAAVVGPDNALSDDFNQDSNLNASLWQINGAVGTDFASVNCPSCTLITLAPSFSTAGMEIAQINGSAEIGTIQSVESFAPPFTADALVEGTISDGHPFVFGISSQNASSGVQITGNLNPDDCSHLSDCGDAATCGIPANASIQAGQCFYGIYARIGTSNASWTKSPMLNRTPSVGVTYTLQISVDASGGAQYAVSEGGQELGTSTTTVGLGPFYLILAQSEGAPVPGPGPNQAYWSSVALTPTAANIGPSPSGSSSSGLSAIEWTLLVVLLAAAIVVILVVARRRRDLTVTVLDGGTLAPVPGAGVSATGLEHLSGSTGQDGRVAFGSVKRGDYAVQAAAAGYAPSAPATVSVRGSAKYTVNLARSVEGTGEGVGSAASAGGLDQLPQVPANETSPTSTVTPVAATGPPAGAPVPASAAAIAGLEGWRGERIREIVRTFQAKGAVSPETALTADELGLSRVFVRAMKRRKGQTRVFIETDGKYYLNEKALNEGH